MNIVRIIQTENFVGVILSGGLNALLKDQVNTVGVQTELRFLSKPLILEDTLHLFLDTGRQEQTPTRTGKATKNMLKN